MGYLHVPYLLRKRHRGRGWLSSVLDAGEGIGEQHMLTPWEGHSCSWWNHPALLIHNHTIATIWSHVSMRDLALEETTTIASLLWPMGDVCCCQAVIATKDENGRKTPLLFSTFIFEYEHENGNDIAGNEIENELSVFRKRTNSIEIMSNTVGIRKFNTKYRPTVHNLKNVHDQTKKCMITW